MLNTCLTAARAKAVLAQNQAGSSGWIAVTCRSPSSACPRPPHPHQRPCSLRPGPPCSTLGPWHMPFPVRHFLCLWLNPHSWFLLTAPPKRRHPPLSRPFRTLHMFPQGTSSFLPLSSSSRDGRLMKGPLRQTKKSPEYWTPPGRSSLYLVLVLGGSRTHRGQLLFLSIVSCFFPIRPLWLRCLGCRINWLEETDHPNPES